MDGRPLYVDGCDVCFDPATAHNVRANLGAVGGRTHLLRPGDTQALGPGEVLDGRGCLALPALVDGGGRLPVAGVMAPFRDGPRPHAVCPLLADLARREGEQRAAVAATVVAAWHHAGCRVLAGTPCGAGSLVDELEWLVRGGLTPGEALGAATAQWGAHIAEGGPADWLIVAGGPLARIAALRCPRHVVAGGVRVGGE